MSKKSKPAGWPEFFPAAFSGFANPLQGHTESPFAESIAGGMEVMRAMMGGMPSTVPGFVVPTVDLDELDKRIKDLRAVESWLELNANMLKATIQGLDVQRNTIAALKSYGGAGTAMARTLAAKVASRDDAAARDRAPAAHGDEGAGQHIPAGWPMPAAMHATADDDAPEDAAPIADKGKHKKGAPKHPPSASSGHPALAASTASATAWMSFLQDQFARVASAAIAPPAARKTVKTDAVAPSAKKRTPRKKVVQKKVARKKRAAKRVLAPRA